MLQSDRNLFHLSTQKKAASPLLEMQLKGNESGVVSQIGNRFEARGDWNVSMGDVAPLNHTAFEMAGPCVGSTFFCADKGMLQKQYTG